MNIFIYIIIKIHSRVRNIAIRPVSPSREEGWSLNSCLFLTTIAKTSATSGCGSLHAQDNYSETISQF